ncbi:MAG: hypothetical protein AMXMBFR56_79950 [Polyangiaceae bacterium]
MKRPLHLLILALAMGAPAPARGDDGQAAAARRFAAGSQAYRAGKYLAAARAFEESHAQKPVAAVTFSAAQAYRRQYFVDADFAWLERAKLLYRRYLDEQPDGGRREHAVTHLYAIELLLARRTSDERPPPQALPTQVLVSCEATGARISLDGGPPRVAPLVQDVTPGQHRVRVTAPGHRPEERRVLAVAQRLATVTVELTELPGEVLVVTAPGTEVWMDGTRVGVAPLPPLDTSAGVHSLTLMRSGRRSVSRSVRVARGARTTIEVDLQPSDQRLAAHWTLGGSAALALGSAVSGTLALLAERDAKSLKDDISAGRTLSPAERDRYNASLERRDGFRTASVGLLGAALVSGSVGALLYVFDSPAPPPAARDRAAHAGRRSAKR